MYENDILTQWRELAKLDKFHTYLKEKYGWNIKVYEEITRENNNPLDEIYSELNKNKT